MRTTESDEHHGENTQGREVLRCSDELRHPCWFRKYGLSCLDLPQHSTDHRRIDNDRRGPRHRRVSGTDIRHSGSSVLLDIYKSDFSLSRSHLSSCQTLDPDLGRKTLLPTRSTPHANPANPHTNRTKTKTNRTQPIGKSINPTGTPLVRESDGLGPNIIPSLRTTRTENPLLDASNIDMTGKVCLVTGGNSGIGKATALGLAKLNASVVIVSRDKDKGEATLIEMRAKSGNRNLDAMTADLSSQDSVRELAHDFKGRYVQWSNDLQYSTTCSAGPATTPFDLQQTSDGGFVVAGYAYAPACTYSPFVAKLSLTGQIQWQHLFADQNTPYSTAYAVRQTPDGGYVVAGGVDYYNSSSTVTSKILVFKLDTSGALVWQHNYLVGTDSYPESLALTSDGGFIVSGSVAIETATGYTSSVLLLKLDSTGNPQFAKTYAPSGSISDLAITGVQQTSDGGYAFSGYYFQNTVYDERAWLVKTDSTGKVQWDRTYGADVQYS